ncbi:MAG: peroxiredoxin [Pseudorhodoplanes sp.]|nr:Glutathione amide-dependent peroxidase [Pseudorhodoplanes sp.]MBW7948196.1 peroxiredoxin [Pseudorhodoplanes sp.]MCL4710438.1 peroxiredoxin [Pseudorhodoplanes sp.]MCQ3942788.1 peroxiredoxin [Alphaproteobacteria bacterium]GIK81279.1 MAG: peroxiredoxin [Alphaproteobacteria bacterium]
MTIKVGDRLPNATFRIMTDEGPKTSTTDDVFKGKKVALFGMPGAFTGACHGKHMPTVFQNIRALKSKGVDTVAVTTVNDPFVLGAWQKAIGTNELLLLGDGNAEFASAIGLTFDGSHIGFGTRSQRYSMLVEDGVVKQLNVEQPGKFEVSGGDTLLKQL